VIGIRVAQEGALVGARVWRRSLRRCGLAVVATAALVTACAKKQTGTGTTAGGALGSGVLAQVNDAKLTDADLQRLIPPELRDGISGSEIRDILDRWVQSELLYQRARKDGIENDPQVEARLNEIRRDLLADEFLQRELSTRVHVSNEELQAYYQAHLPEYTQELQLKHILVNTRAEAEEILGLVRAGTSFEELARQRSRDATAARGGDLGFLGKGAMNPAFEPYVFGLSPGQVAGPIATTFGFHVVKVAAKRQAAEALSFDAVRDEIMHSLLLDKQQTAQQQLLDELRKASTVQMATTYAGMTLDKSAPGADDASDAAGRTSGVGSEAQEPVETGADSLGTVHE
jgi:peptidyl-prolyl cis-trans isomerase C